MGVYDNEIVFEIVTWIPHTYISVVKTLVQDHIVTYWSHSLLERNKHSFMMFNV